MKRKPSNSELIPPKEPPKNPAVEKARAILEKKQEAFRRERSRHKRNDPIKMKARAKVNNAIQKGHLIPEDCEYQFKGCRLHATEAHHHKGYNPGNELNIKWVCKPCHDKISVNERTKNHFRTTNKSPHSFPSQIIHIIGPPLSGKSYVLKEANVPDDQIWSLIDFYHRVKAVIPGEPFPPRLRLLNPKEYYAKVGTMQHDLHNWVTQSRADILFIESSGKSKRVNKYLDVHKHDFKTHLIKLQAPDLNTLVYRCKLKGLDVIAQKGLIESWRWQQLDEKVKEAREYTQEEAIEAISYL